MNQNQCHPRKICGDKQVSKLPSKIRVKHTNVIDRENILDARAKFNIEFVNRLFWSAIIGLNVGRL